MKQGAYPRVRSEVQAACPDNFRKASAAWPRRSHDDYWQISPKIIAGLLVLLALGISMIQETRAAGGIGSLFDLLLYAAAGAIWLVDSAQPSAARWLTVALSLALLAMGASLVWGPLLWMLLFLPVLLAMLLLGLQPALLTAVAASLLYLVAQQGGAPGADPLLVLFSLWAPTLLFSLFVVRLQQLLDQWSETLQRARAEVEETRDRKLERESMLAELTWANRNLHLLNERINAMRAMAEEAHQAKAAFVANISHEFRTPLNMIIGMIDTLTQRPQVYGEAIPTLLRQDLEVVRRNASHLAGMVNDVLDMSQSETGQLQLRRECGDLGADLRQAVAVVQPLLDKKHLRLEFLIADDLPQVFYDRARIRQVVLNLVSNAARYTDAGSICVHVANEGDHVVVGVRDTGLGIPADDLEKIFEPFYQARNVGDRGREGSGLGLNICRLIVAQHDGRIWATSQEEQGTTVAFRLPVQPAAATASSLRWLDQDWVYVNRANWPAPPRLANRQRILVLDEVGVLKQRFAGDRTAVELVHVDSADEAARLLTSAPAHAMILNVHPPAALLARLEAVARTPALADLPLVGCTLPSPYAADKLPGVHQTLIKPVQYTQLAQAVATLASGVRRVLVVDDNVDAAHLFARMMSLIGEEIATQVVHNGVDALAQMRMQPPDLILLDLVMPQMDGKALLQIKNADPAIRSIPVIIVSAEDPAPQAATGMLLAASLQRGMGQEAVLQLAYKVATLLVQSPATLDQDPG